MKIMTRLASLGCVVLFCAGPVVASDTAIVAFKLVGRPTDESVNADVLYYFNTGTFLRRDGVWQVIAWQATKIPPQ